MAQAPAEPNKRAGTHGRILFVNLSTQASHVEPLDESIYQQFLGGYGLGAYLMWRHFPEKTDAMSPSACFAIVAGLLTGARAPFSGRIQIVAKSPLTGGWADSNSGGSVASQLRRAGFDALVVSGKAPRPTVLSIHDGEVRFEDAADVWGKEIPETFDILRERYGKQSEVGVSAIGPAGEQCARISSVMNDRYHAFGRQGFGAVYGSKNLKAIVVRGSGELPIADPVRFKDLCQEITQLYRRDNSWWMRLILWLTAPRRWMGFLFRALAPRGIKMQSPAAVMRQLWAKRGTTSALAITIENGDGPVKNWKGVGSRDFPMATKSHKLDGAQVDKILTKKLSCGDCPAPCKGIVAIKERKLSDVRRPDYETLAGFGANLLNDDLGVVTACHDACNRYGIDALSASATLAWVAECVEEGILSKDDLDGIDMRWGQGEAALALTIKMGRGDGCGKWLQNGVKMAAAHVGKGSEKFAVHVGGQEPAYHDSRFTSLMGVTYIADPTPGRHTAGSASWNETFGSKFPLPGAVPQNETEVAWHGRAGKGVAQAHFSNAQQVLNGLGLCMFTTLLGGLNWLDLVSALTGWQMNEKELLACGERIQNLRNAFNRREGILPADVMPHPRMLGEGDGNLTAGPLRGVKVPLLVLRDDYYDAMGWNRQTGRLMRSRAEQLGIDRLLGPYVEG